MKSTFVVDAVTECIESIFTNINQIIFDDTLKSLSGYIPVCRSVCERARKGCEPVMAQYRFSWPDRMNCDQLPVFGGDSLCMDERLQNGQLSFDEQFARTLDSDDEEDNESSQVPPPPSSSTSSTLGGGNRPVGGGQVAGTMFDLFGDKEPVDSSEHERPIRPTIVVSTSRPNTHRKSNRKHRPGHRRPTSNVHWKAHNFSLTGRGMSSPFDRLPAFDLLPSDHCKCECRAPFLAIDTRRVFGRHGGQEIRTGGQSNCAFPCHSPYFTKTEEHSANFWITCFSAVCALCTLLTLATFISDPGRFRYPERCIIFLSACYLMVSCGFLLRHLVGHERVACDSPPDSHLSWTLIRYENTGQIPTNCLLIFWLLYFFGMCASLWWVMLTLTWFLAAALKWSSEAIDSYSQYFHLIAWFTPAVKSILIVSSGAIDGEPFTGQCVANTLY